MKLMTVRELENQLRKYHPDLSSVFIDENGLAIVSGRSADTEIIELSSMDELRAVVQP
jgi:hypothetical protein